MPDSEFRGFDVTRVTEAVRQPPLDELRSAARSRRHRSVTGAVAAALVVLAGVTVVPLTAGPDRAGPTVPTPRRESSRDFTLTGPDSGVDVRRYGCDLSFDYTDDGGRSWSGEEDMGRFFGLMCEATTTATADGVLKYTVLDGRSLLVDDAGLLRISTDRGRSWRPWAQAIVSVPAFPATARPVFCGFGCGAMREPLAVDPSTGTVYRLSGTAPSWRALRSVYPSADGTLWATYQMPAAPGATVARSADRGATWTTWETGVDVSVLAVAGRDDREGYLLTQPSTGSPRLLRTTDGGQTWTQTRAHLPSQGHWDLTIGTDGSLLAITNSGPDPAGPAQLLVSRDDGQTFLVSRQYGTLVGSVSVIPGYAWLFGGADGEPDHLLLTADAEAWTRLTLAP